MISKIVGWFLHKKFLTEDGEYYYKGISITKVGILLMAILKAIETSGIFHFIVPSYVYELLAAITGIALRNSMEQTPATQISAPPKA